MDREMFRGEQLYVEKNINEMIDFYTLEEYKSKEK